MTRFHFGILGVALAGLVLRIWPAVGPYAVTAAVLFLLYLLWCYHREESNYRDAVRRHSATGWSGDWLG